MSSMRKVEISNKFSQLDRYYLDIIACMPHLVYVLDKNCTFRAANTNFLNLLNLTRIEDLLGHSFKDIMQWMPWSEERVQLLKQEDIKVLLSEEAVYNKEEAPVIDKNDNLIHFISNRIPLLNENQEVIGLVVVLMDVTEYKKMQEQFNKIKEELQRANAKPMPQKAASVEDKAPPKVLMIEDNTAAQKAAQFLLMQLDCHVDIAESGDKAENLFKPGKYDLVFMDIGLEDTSGYVVAKKIRQKEQGTNYHVPIIALTGYEADVVKYDCADYSMEGALTKPLTSEQAKQIIQHYIYHIDIPVSGLKTAQSANRA